MRSIAGWRSAALGAQLVAGWRRTRFLSSHPLESNQDLSASTERADQLHQSGEWHHAAPRRAAWCRCRGCLARHPHRHRSSVVREAGRTSGDNASACPAGAPGAMRNAQCDTAHHESRNRSLLDVGRCCARPSRNAERAAWSPLAALSENVTRSRQSRGRPPGLLPQSSFAGSGAYASRNRHEGRLSARAGWTRSCSSRIDTVGSWIQPPRHEVAWSIPITAPIGPVKPFLEEEVYLIVDLANRADRIGYASDTSVTGAVRPSSTVRRRPSSSPPTSIAPSRSSSMVTRSHKKSVT